MTLQLSKLFYLLLVSLDNFPEKKEDGDCLKRKGKKEERRERMKGWSKEREQVRQAQVVINEDVGFPRH